MKLTLKSVNRCIKCGAVFSCTATEPSVLASPRGLLNLHLKVPMCSGEDLLISKIA